VFPTQNRAVVGPWWDLAWDIYANTYKNL
jgi:hypothetical protein